MTPRSAWSPAARRAALLYRTARMAERAAEQPSYSARLGAGADWFIEFHARDDRAARAYAERYALKHDTTVIHVWREGHGFVWITGAPVDAR